MTSPYPPSKGESGSNDLLDGQKPHSNPIQPEERTKIGVLRLKTVILNACTALDQGLVGEAKEILRRGLENG